MMSRQSLEQRVEVIERRNERVGKDKAWEISLLRRLIVTSLTYAIVFFYLLAINADNPAITAVVPAIGYFLSTLVIKSVKDWWMNK